MHDFFDGAAPAAPTTQLLGYQVPIDPMDELQCESCQLAGLAPSTPPSPNRI